MTTTTKTAFVSQITPALRRAIDHIGACRVGTRWHYKADEIGRVVSVTTAELRRLGKSLEAGEQDAYSHWCASTPTRLVRVR